MEDLFNHPLEIQAGAIDRDIGIFLVQQNPLGIHSLEALARKEDDPPALDVPKPFFYLFKRDLQVNDCST